MGGVFSCRAPTLYVPGLGQALVCTFFGLRHARVAMM